MTYWECLRGVLMGVGPIVWIFGSIGAAAAGVLLWEDRPRWLCVTMIAGGFVSLIFAIAMILYVTGN